ncbi:hypothetical protein VNO77_09150 [Canavalia gladiata]|uniref:Uncharacterized protein n=1 Tax=Canavalia gladiata TaxID=3824 RepID=A0AAN9M8Z0_CANGL
MNERSDPEKMCEPFVQNHEKYCMALVAGLKDLNPPLWNTNPLFPTSPEDTQIRLYKMLGYNPLDILLEEKKRHSSCGTNRRYRHMISPNRLKGFGPPKAIRNDQPLYSTNQKQKQRQFNDIMSCFDEFNIETQEEKERHWKDLEVTIAMMEFRQSLSPCHVININGENEAMKLTNKCSTFLEFCSRAIIHSTPELRGTLLVTLYGVQLGQLWALGNPFDMLSQSTSTSKDPHKQLLSLGQAFSMSLPAIIWSAMFFLNFAYTTILAWSLPFRVPIVSMQLISLVYYFLATSKMLAFSVLWGSVKMPGLLFAFGGAFSFVLLTTFLIFGVLCILWRYFPKLEK